MVYKRLLVLSNSNNYRIYFIKKVLFKGFFLCLQLMKIDFSFIIPVYNRPDEIDELLQSMSLWETSVPFEVVIVEDGSQVKCDQILKNYIEKLHISYYYKPNSGPGDSRNYGMSKAMGSYFIILDSDVIMPRHYLDEVYKELQNNYVDFFGGPDAADQSFSNIQKSINFSMTSFITTGGIRGGKNNVNKYEPRSFNMGISKKAYQASGGFGRIHPGEDPDLSIRLDKLGYHSRLLPNAYVYHKRRISWSKFYKQVNKFGRVRPILNKWHPQSAKIIFWFPSLFIIGFIISLLLFVFNIHWPLLSYLTYLGVCFIASLLESKNFIVAFLSIAAVCIQFFGYGIGFLKSQIILLMKKGRPEDIFPSLFFKE